MKILAISDTHGRHKKLTEYLPEADMIIHSGDMCSHGSQREFRRFHKWWKGLDYKYKIVVPGNHDVCLQKNRTLWSLFYESGTRFLVEKTTVIEGIKFYGSPWVPQFFDWAWMTSRGESMASKWAKVPEDTDILITHGPPFGYGDKNADNDRCGC
ncbi:metallophosphoesterase, partial [Candidatus Pacearchaeota archaeon]|nr:metallophosphoesterase [Candidatus Pacearchaeota archaeon]